MINSYYYNYYNYCLVVLLLLLCLEFTDCTCIYSFQCVAVNSSGVFTAFLIVAFTTILESQEQEKTNLDRHVRRLYCHNLHLAKSYKPM